MVRLPSGALAITLCSLPVALFSATSGAAEAATESAPAATPSWPADAELEAEGARIGNVTVRVLPIFDPSKPGEHNALFRLADRWHMDTRESAVRAQLLFKPGDLYSRRMLDETERAMRSLHFMREPEIRVSGYHDGLVDLEVSMHDTWTLSPGASFGRAGGKNSQRFSLEELNLLGFGKQLAVTYQHNVDRSSYTFYWNDPNVAGTRWQSTATVTDSDDGKGQTLSLERPFFALDTRWSTGLAYVHDDATQNVYRLGHKIAEYQRNTRNVDVHYGWSRGLQDGWTRRWIVGIRRESAEFALIPDATAPAALPEDRDFRYPFLRLDAIQDDYETTRNLDQISRTEDLHFGLHYLVELGWADTGLDADRDALMFRAGVSRGFRLGEGETFFAGTSLTSRLEHGSPEDALLSGSLRYHRRTGPRSTFFASLSGDAGHDLDADHEPVLGGEEGLRGYPLRYQTGDSRALLTIEQRIYTNYTIFSVAEVGGAVFADVGRTWGKSAFGPTESQGLLKNIGFGLRLGNNRSATGNVLHVDVAFPLDGDSSIKSVQFVVRTKATF